MFVTGFENFLTVWFAVLALVYAMSGCFVGVTLFFAAMVTLYVLLPFFFFPADADLFGLLLAAVTLGVLGFHIGLTGFSGLSERRLLGQMPPRRDADHTGRTAVALVAFSLTVLLLWRPGFLAEVGTYEGRVNLSGQFGPLVFLLDQAIVGAAILIIWAYWRRRFVLALAISAVLVGWAVYSSAKISLLAVIASWLSIFLIATWRNRIRNGVAFALFALVMPASLMIMMFYAVLRSGVTDLALAADALAANLDRLGAVGGIHVGDFGGPYWVFTQHLRDRFLELTLGSTYIDQLLVLIPRVMRGGFLDLTDSFAQAHYGAAYLPGLGFAFSPWAEGYMNFRVIGFFVEGLLFGLLTRALLRVTARLFGLNEIVIFFQIVLITYFDRNYFIGQIKATIVFCLPFLATWSALDMLMRRPLPRLPLPAIGKLRLVFDRASREGALPR
jgi:hypothetical protein